MTFKEFNAHTNIVTVKTSGHVYAYDAIEQLCIQPKNWRDLITDAPFTRADILTLQDPQQPTLKDISRFHYTLNGIVPISEQQPGKYTAASNSMAGRILKELDGTETSVLPSIRAPEAAPLASSSSAKGGREFHHFSTGTDLTIC